MEYSETLFWSSNFPWARVWQHFGVPGVTFIWSTLKFAALCIHRPVSTHRLDAVRMRALGSTWRTADRQQLRAMDGRWPWRRCMKYLWAQAKRTFWGSFISIFPFLKKEQSEVRSSCVCLSLWPPFQAHRLADKAVWTLCRWRPSQRCASEFPTISK